jgi:hypothetical protein
MYKNLCQALAVLSVTFVVAFSRIPETHAGYVGVRAGVNSHNVSLTSASGQTSWFVGGYGGIDFGVPLLSLDGGIGIQERKFKTTGGGSTKVSSYRTILADAVLRVGLPFIGIGIGPYAAVALPGVDTTIDGKVQSSHSLGAEGLRYGDYGGLGSIRARLPLPGIAFTADARYLLGLNDLTTSGDTTSKTREFQFLVGMDFSP